MKYKSIKSKVGPEIRATTNDFWFTMENLLMIYIIKFAWNNIQGLYVQHTYV